MASALRALFCGCGEEAVLRGGGRRQSWEVLVLHPCLHYILCDPSGQTDGWACEWREGWMDRKAVS